MSKNGKIVSQTPQCQIIWYKWKEESVPDSLTYSDIIARSCLATGFDISNHLIEGCTFTKTLSSAAGNFSFKLDASRDWRKELKPGQWCLLYLSNSGELNLPPRSELSGLPQAPTDLTGFKKNLRALCHIERVAVVASTDGKGALDVVYEISGRDYGMIYEETNMWFSYFLFEQSKVRGAFDALKVSQEQGIHSLVELAHKLFFSPDEIIPIESLTSGNSLTSINQQWLLPAPLVSALGLNTKGKAPFFGNVVNLNFSKTKVTRFLENPFDLINGTAWAKLKSVGISPELHELFPELDENGTPQLIFRPIPFAIDTSAYSFIAEVITQFQDLKNSAVVIPAENFAFCNLGRDEHSRYNHFLVQVLYSYLNLQSNISVLKGQGSASGRFFPFGSLSSIARYGFKPMHIEVQSFPAAVVGRDISNPKGGASDGKLLLEYNELLLDYWKSAVLMDTGSASIEGMPEIKVGKGVFFDEALENIGGKLFYIEGYTDEFSIDENGATSWTQTLQLTRGATIDELRRKFEELTIKGEFASTGDYTGR